MKTVRFVLIGLAMSLLALGLPGSEDKPSPQPATSACARDSAQPPGKPADSKPPRVCKNDKRTASGEAKGTGVLPQDALAASTDVPKGLPSPSVDPSEGEAKGTGVFPQGPLAIFVGVLKGHSSPSGNPSEGKAEGAALASAQSSGSQGPRNASTLTPPAGELRKAEVKLVRVLSDSNDPGMADAADAANAVKTADLEQSVTARFALSSARDADGGETSAPESPEAEPESPTRQADLSGSLPEAPLAPPVNLPPEPAHEAEESLALDYASNLAPVAVAGNWRLSQPRWLARRRVRLGGWAELGLSSVANNPADRYNGVVGFNDRHGEAQLNQLYFFLEREPFTADGGWDLGGRADFLFGTDARFVQAADGLEEHWDQTARFYQAALPQLYLDVAYRDWTLRLGHFYTILGYEVVPAPENFFYSHAYTMLYGEPFTHTGFLLFREFGERLKLTAGLTRGNDQFDDTDGLDSVDFLGGLTWTSPSRRFSAALGVAAGEQGPGIRQTIYSLVGTWKATGRLRYIIQHDYGCTDVDHPSPLEGQWYGLNQYFLYDLNQRWAAGLRFEWFRDADGTRVRGLGDGNLNQGPFEGDFFELTAGLNWRPRANLLVRPEIRWDWYQSDLRDGPLPYDAGEADDQFLAGVDVVVTY